MAAFFSRPRARRPAPKSDGRQASAPALAAIVAAALLAGCASTYRGGGTEATYAAMDCNGLNRAMAGVSAELSRNAITRGEIARSWKSHWLPGRSAAADERLTKQIERLQEEERIIAAARARNCPRQAH